MQIFQIMLQRTIKIVLINIRIEIGNIGNAMPNKLFWEEERALCLKTLSRSNHMVETKKWPLQKKFVTFILNVCFLSLYFFLHIGHIWYFNSYFLLFFLFVCFLFNTYVFSEFLNIFRKASYYILYIYIFFLICIILHFYFERWEMNNHHMQRKFFTMSK